MSHTAKDPMLGEIVADHYLIRAVLGEGGMGKVYRAVQLDLERSVALKLLDLSLAADQRQMDRFHQEAISASRLNHPGVVVVHDHSLGVILYELLCGRPPFVSDNPAQVVLGHLYGEPSAPEREDSAAAALADLAMDALAKDAGHRPASAEVFQEYLLAAVGLGGFGEVGTPVAKSVPEAPPAVDLLPTLADLPGPLIVRIVAGSEQAAGALSAVLKHAGIEIVLEVDSQDGRATDEVMVTVESAANV